MEWVEPLNARMEYGELEISTTQVVGEGKNKPDLSNTEPYAKINGL